MNTIPSCMTISLDQTLKICSLLQQYIGRKWRGKRSIKFNILLSVSRCARTCKSFVKKKFTLWSADQVTRALDERKEIKDVEINFKLSIVKPLHAKWLTEIYNHTNSSEGRGVCLKGWKVSLIFDTVEKGLDGLPLISVIGVKIHVLF